MIRIEQLKCRIDHDPLELNKKIRKKLMIPEHADMPAFSIRRRALDARYKPDLFYVYTIDVFLSDQEEQAIAKKCRDQKIRFMQEEKYELPAPVSCQKAHGPVVIGSGPAGLFCAYILALCGMHPVVIERGERIEDRSKRVEKCWEEDHNVHPESNVQFGEGGAGTFSDGKLNTLVKDKAHRNRFVLEAFVRFGAPEEITYVAKPHLGTDVLKTVVSNMRNEIISLGGTFLFGYCMDDLFLQNGKLTGIRVSSTFPANELPDDFAACADDSYRRNTDTLVLAIGHSARDTFSMLCEKGLKMEQKNFAVGLRIEHPQDMIDRSQYGDENAGKLPAADYKLTRQCTGGRSVYSFCMCPGGYVVNASSEEHMIAVNGMSYSKRDSGNANSALIVSVDRNDFGSDHPLAGMEFQRKLERNAWEIGKGHIPVQRFEDYLKKRESEAFGKIRPLMKGRYHFADLNKIFTEPVNEALKEAIEAFDKQIHGFADPDCVLSGVESRTSSPVRIVRSDDFMSNITGIYPCGEGAGYAGGITSAAMDGMKVAEAIIRAYNKQDKEETI
ncbi:MAG: FAD-dependent oxidoreductase [Lachnospiraceae bacterium]|nr:FAD-dependent oxidoreductase [Lachnospiraceae bacterium]